MAEKIESPAWLVKPSTDSTRFEFLQRVIASLLIAGDTFIFVVRDTNGTIVDMIPIQPDLVDTKRDGNGRKFFSIGGKRFTTYEILHVPAFIRPSGSRSVARSRRVRRSLLRSGCDDVRRRRSA
jgi:Phage portal protein